MLKKKEASDCKHLVCDRFFCSLLCIMSETADMPNMFISGTAAPPSCFSNDFLTIGSQSGGT